MPPMHGIGATEYVYVRSPAVDFYGSTSFILNEVEGLTILSLSKDGGGILYLVVTYHAKFKVVSGPIPDTIRTSGEASDITRIE